MIGNFPDEFTFSEKIRSGEGTGISNWIIWLYAGFILIFYFLGMKCQLILENRLKRNDSEEFIATYKLIKDNEGNNKEAFLEM